MQTLKQKFATFTRGACLLCKSYPTNASALCTSCKVLLQPLHFACSICRYPLMDTSFSLCGSCIKKKPHFDKVFTAYIYNPLLRRLIHDFKYQEALYLQRFLAELMQHALDGVVYQPDYIVPIPMYPDRIKIRGFNQAALLARSIAKNKKGMYAPKLCQKIRNTPNQVLLTRTERQVNLKNAFRVLPCLGKKICLVDDVLTTGSTANELARLFKKAGATEVTVLCCARAII